MVARAEAADSVMDVSTDNVVTITPTAMDHLIEMKQKQKLEGPLFMRMGVRSGGCSGMSYVMDLCKPEDVAEDDHVEDFGDVRCFIDPKSLLYLFGELGLRLRRHI